MGLKAGIIGLPNVGKSTLFNAITNSRVEAANYPFATIEPNVGVVNLADTRLAALAKITKTQQIIAATFEFIDIAGLVAGASKGEGLGNKFLANIRETDAIIQVVRCFENSDITHVANSIDPLRDIGIINLELLFADLAMLEKIVQRVSKKALHSTDKAAKVEYQLLQKAQSALEREVPLRELTLTTSEQQVLKNYNFLTLKPLLYVANVAEAFVSDATQSRHFQTLAKFAQAQQTPYLAISIQIEQELSELDAADKAVFLNELKIAASGLNRLVATSFELLNLATFFTAGKQEVRAWVFQKGMQAPQCAGIIHTDFEKGFIKAEVIAYDDYFKYGGENGAKAQGKARLEGKNYVMKDGDVCHFRFNV